MITLCRHEIESCTKMVKQKIKHGARLYQFDYAKPSLFSTNDGHLSSADVDGTTLTVDTDHLFNSNTGRLKLKTSTAQIVK